jgi:hypothetical protein
MSWNDVSQFSKKVILELHFAPVTAVRAIEEQYQ